MSRDFKSNSTDSSLFARGLTDPEVMRELRKQYKDEELVTKAFEEYRNRYDYIVKRARKFHQLILDRYSSMNLSFEDLVRKAKKYAKKHELADDEFDLYFKVAMSGEQGALKLPVTTMSKTLGFSMGSMTQTDKLNVKPEEMGSLKEILALYEQTKPLHAQVVLQSLTYQDCGPEAFSGKFDSSKHNAFAYIHPTLAFLFFPRIGFFDEHMLLANLGYIVKCKFEGKPLMTKPDWELYWDLVMDPNHSACSIENPIADLHNRFILQTRIWECVRSLRQGQYYNDMLQLFISAVDSCKSNIYDAPDLSYVKDEATIVRRILSAFSIRPTIVATTRVTSMISTSYNNPFGVTVDPYTAAGIQSMTTVPMITLRLPYSFQKGASAVQLTSALSQPQWYIENKMFVPKQQHIMFSRDILMFHVGRRYQSINLARLQAPYNFTALPMTVGQYESVNSTAVNFDRRIQIENDFFDLRSVVCLSTLGGDKADSNRMVIGCNTVIFPKGANAPVWLYDPILAGSMYTSIPPATAGTTPTAYAYPSKPIFEIPEHIGYQDDDKSADYMIQHFGSIFLYEKCNKTSASCADF